MSWQTIKLGELCTIEKGATGIQKAIPGEYPMVVTSEERKSHNEYQFDDEAVIIPLVSSTGHGHKSLKRIHYQTGKFALGSILCAVIPKNKKQLNAEYLFRYLDLNKENELVARMKGMANVTLPLKEIADIDIPVPPLSEQLHFIERYELTETHSDGLRNELLYQTDLLTQLRQSFLREAMQGKLVKQNPKDGYAKDLLAKIKAEKFKSSKKEKELPPIKPEEIPFEIPENWVWCRLSEIGRITGGGTPSMSNPEYWNGNIPWVSPKDMGVEFVSDTEMKVTKKGVEESTANLIPIGSLLIVGRSGILKRKLPVAINRVECTVNQDMKVIIPYLTLMNRYLQFMFYGIEDIILKDYVKFGMTVHSLRYNEFALMPIPLPPLNEQAKIVEKLEEMMTLCGILQKSIQDSREQNELLLQQVLKEALIG